MIKRIKVGNKMYDLISEGDNNKVIKWEEGTVAKLFDLGNKQAKAELELLQAANKVNTLLVKGIRTTYSPCYNYEMVVMERLIVLDKRTLSLSEKKVLINTFKLQLGELHNKGFVHGDIKRPATYQRGDIWDNVCITPDGIRLIDVGCSSLNATPEAVALDVKEANEFVTYFLE